MALGIIAEALARIEHKLDLLLQNIKYQHVPVLTGVGDKSHTCPLCKQQVKYVVDVIKKVLTRQCGCKTGLQPPIDLAAFAPPALPARERADGHDQEDRSDPSDRGERRRR
jgi:hypothetical protein